MSQLVLHHGDALDAKPPKRHSTCAGDTSAMNDAHPTAAEPLEMALIWQDRVDELLRDLQDRDRFPAFEPPKITLLPDGQRLGWADHPRPAPERTTIRKHHA